MSVALTLRGGKDGPEPLDIHNKLKYRNLLTQNWCSYIHHIYAGLKVEIPTSSDCIEGQEILVSTPLPQDLDQLSL